MGNLALGVFAISDVKIKGDWGFHICRFTSTCSLCIKRQDSEFWTSKKASKMEGNDEGNVKVDEQHSLAGMYLKNTTEHLV